MQANTNTKRKQSITRSVSQFEEPTTQEDSPNVMSRSYDGVLDTCGQNTLPVPPPRKHRTVAKDSESVQQSVVTNKVPMRQCASATNMADMRRHKYFGQKRVSNDSLGSVEEYPSDIIASTLHPPGEDFQHLQARHGDLGTLHKSESGARLYINEDIVNNARYTEPSVGNNPPVSVSSSKQLTHHSSLRRNHLSKTASVPAVRHSWNADLESITSTSTSSSSTNRPHPPSTLSTSYPEPKTFALSDSVEEKSKDSVDCKDSVVTETPEEKVAAPKPPETIAVIQVPKGSMSYKPSQPQRSEPVQRRRAGMTEKGSDIFPAHIRRSLCHSADPGPFRPHRDVVAEIPRSAQLVRALNLEPSKSPPQQMSIRRPEQPPTYQEALRRKQLTITERDAREEKLRQERARKLYQQSLDLYEQQQDSRPSLPPSYEQAVQRAEQIKRQSSPTKEAKKVPRVRRHGHRSSDTRLDSSSRSSTGHKVTRSKSDSSDHLHKLAKLQVNESTDSEEEWPAVQRRLRLSKSVERVPSKDKLSEVKKVIKREERGGYDSGSDSTTEMSKPKPRARIQSLRNRDWHKELSEAYSQVFYQPPESNEPKYAYVRPTPKEEELTPDS